MTKHGLSVYERVMLRTLRTQSGCLEFTGHRDRAGYGKLGTTRKGEPFKHESAHRVVYEHHHGPLEPGVFVLHSCDNPPCVEETHLHAGTAADNVREMHERGRARQGEPSRGAANHLAKLTDAEVDEIRALRAQGWSNPAVARKFGVTAQHVSRICTGKRRRL